MSKRDFKSTDWYKIKYSIFPKIQSYIISSGD